MATTVAERKLFVAGEWIETGEWIEVRSPYSGEVVGRVAKAGADETRRGLDPGQAARRAPAAGRDGGAGGAAAGPQARGDLRSRRLGAGQAPRRGRADDLRRGGQADE